MTVLDPNMTLEEARAWLRERVDDGEICPCCNQLARVYERRVNAGQARSLIHLVRVGGTDWQHLPTVLEGISKGHEEGRLRYWGLIEKATERREDGGPSGWWRVTPLGVEYVHRRLRIDKYARVYDDRVLKYHGPQVDVVDALGKAFNYRELMQGI